MGRNFIVLFSAVAFMLAACTAQMMNQEQGPAISGEASQKQFIAPGTVATLDDSASPSDPHTSSNDLDHEAGELQQCVSQAPGARIEKLEDLIAITFGADILFGSESCILKPEGNAEIYHVAEVLKKYPDTMLKIVGHTDAAGSDQQNVNVSERRACAVMDSLVNAGIPPSRVSAEGFGSAKPVAPNSTEEGRQLNRRVIIQVLPSRT